MPGLISQLLSDDQLKQISWPKIHLVRGADEGNFGSCVLKASVDRVSVDTIGRYVDQQSADISTDPQAICRPRLDRYSGDMSAEIIDRWPTLSVGMSVDTRPTSRPICYDRLSVVFRSTVGGVSIDRQWYREYC